MTWCATTSTHAGQEHLDPAFVAGFDRKRDWPDPSADLEVFAARGAKSVVDLGAGTGQFALPAARRFERVTAVDVSAPIVSELRSRGVASGLSNLECVRGGFLSYAPDSAVDGVYTRNALHQLPDFWKGIALARIASMLRPGRVLRLRDLIYDFAPAEAEPVFAAWCDEASLDPSAGYTADDYAEFDSRLYGAYTCLRRSRLPADQTARACPDRRLPGGWRIAQNVASGAYPAAR